MLMVQPVDNKNSPFFFMLSVRLSRLNCFLLSEKQELFIPYDKGRKGK